MKGMRPTPSYPEAAAQSQSSSVRSAIVGKTIASGGRCRLDVLVYVEDVVWVIARLDLRQPVVVAAVGRADAILTLVHHEVDVRAAGRVGMGRVPVVDAPLAYRRRVGRV